MPPRDPTDCPYYLVSRASLAVTACLKREFAAASVEGVRPAYLGVLMCLWIEDGLNVLELGRRAGLEPSTMTGLLDRMEQDGLVVRAADPHDRRAHRIQLTDLGRRVREPVLEVVDRTLDGVLEGIPERELARVKTTLRSILANTEKIEGGRE